MNRLSSQIIGIGSYVPDGVLTNRQIVFMRPPDISHEDWTTEDWIVSRTGIKQRRVAPANWGSSDLMVEAAKRALDDAKVTIDEIDLIITSTSFADKGFNAPRTSEIFKRKIGAKQETLSLEENAACAGFTWALNRADMEIFANGYKKVLVVSGDKVTSAANYRDRKTCILFGDGSGAIVLEKSLQPGIIASYRETDSTFLEAIEVLSGGSARPTTHEAIESGDIYMRMPGGGDMLKIISGQIVPKVYRIFREKYGNCGRIKYIIPHQANMILLDKAEQRCKREFPDLAEGTLFKDNVSCYGNTSGSSVPIALDTLYQQGKLQKGDLLLLIGFGAGFVYGANLLYWTKNPPTR